ncbi:MAG: muconolactone delta-isomerase, partial [bacterium]
MKITQFSILTFVLVFFIGCGRKTAPEPIQEKGILPQVQKFKGHYRGKYLVFSWSIPAEQQQILSKFSFFYYQSAPRCPICKPSKKEQGVLSIKLPQKVQPEQKEDILVKSKQQKKQENISKKVTQKIELKPKITFLWEDKKKENEKPIFVVHKTHYQLI